MALHPLLRRLAHKPRVLLLADGLGALVSAASLGILLPSLPALFNMPVRVLYALAGVAVVLAMVSLTGYARQVKSIGRYLKIVAAANLAYCLLTIGLVVVWYSQLLVADFVYFGLELAVIGVLVYVELRVARALPTTLQ